MEYLKYLNNNQYEAVTDMSKRILVLAGAGSGKTRVLTTKIKYLLDKNIPESKIIAFTFTNKAAREMKYRVNQLVGKETNVNISTFHSFTFSLVLYLSEHLGFTKTPTIVDEIDKVKLISEIVKELKIDYNQKFFIKAISEIKNYTITKYSTEQDILINQVYQKYQQTLIKHNYVDFDDMIPLYIKLTTLDDSYVKQFIDKYDYILIDECQDTNQIQYDLINVLKHNNSQIFLVGDDDQLIYTFRNSNIDLLNDFKDSADKIIVLNQNYRCSTNILESANKLIQHNNDREQKNLFSKNQNNIPINLKEYDNFEDEAKYISNTIKKLIEKGIEPYQIAILYRNNYQSFPMELELKKLNINYNVYRASSLLTTEEVQAIISFYKLMINPEDILSLEKINYIPLMLTEAKDFLAFKSYHKQSNNTLYGSLMKCDNANLNQFGRELTKLSLNLYTLTKEQFFLEVKRILKIDEYIYNKKNKEDINNKITAFKDLLINSELPIEVFLSNLLLDQEEKTTSKDQVQLMTVHRAKGLEFKIVFIIGVNEGIMPPKNLSKSEIQEERRLFYVAMTRAKEALYISYSITQLIYGKKKNLLPSYFINEADVKQYSNKELLNQKYITK
ncbi:MAG: UvrD-helicase domain-containing protein [Mycoplasmatota bacterium]